MHLVRRTFCSLVALACVSAPVLSHAAESALALRVATVPGQNAVAVNLTGPAGVPVVVTLTATFDPDLPTVTVGRHDLTIGPNGKVDAVFTLAPDYWRGSPVTVTATSVSGVKPASAIVRIVAPNPQVTIPPR